MARKLLKVGANGENTLTELDSESESSAETNRRIDRRILLGFLVSAIWITAGAVYIFGVVGWSNFIGGGMANLGSFLEGAFAPLAFLWLVLGHFIQHTEISSNTRAIKLQERNAQQLEFQSRRDTFFRMMDMVHDQLGNVIGFLYYSIEGPTGTGNMTVDQFAEERTKSSMGDYGLFIRHMIFYVPIIILIRTSSRNFSLVLRFVQGIPKISGIPLRSFTVVHMRSIVTRC